MPRGREPNTAQTASPPRRCNGDEHGGQAGRSKHCQSDCECKPVYVRDRNFLDSGVLVELLRERSAGKLCRRQYAGPVQHNSRISGNSLADHSHGPGCDASSATMKRLFIALLAERAPGTGAVEFALAAAAFLLLMFSIIEMALLVYSYNTISHAARECVRYAIVH